MSNPPSLAAAQKARSVLIVEADPEHRKLLHELMQQQGLRCHLLGSAEEMLAHAARLAPDLLLLRLDLPARRGLNACVQLRTRGLDLPVMLLSDSPDELDLVLGLEGGADDYLRLPCSPRELLARVRRLLRRRSGQASGLPVASEHLVRIGREQFFSPGSKCLAQGDRVQLLGSVECAVLTLLTSCAHKVVTREQLRAAMPAPQNGRAPVQLRAVDAAVMRLRRLLEPDPALPRYIHTVRGAGYLFDPGPDPMS